jgi:hypothetical protein
LKREEKVVNIMKIQYCCQFQEAFLPQRKREREDAPATNPNAFYRNLIISIEMRQHSDEKLTYHNMPECQSKPVATRD